MKLGVLGGTFDPVHLGHTGMAGEAKKALGLDRVILVPAGQPTFKVNRKITPAEHRLQMLRLAVQGRPGLEVSSMEIDRPGPTYTVDTLAELRRRPGPQAEIYFILGWDSLSQLLDWHEPHRLIELSRLVAVPRPGSPRPDMKDLERKIPGISKNVIFLTGPNIDISATVIRDKVARGEKIGDLVPATVAEYVKKHKLYLTSGGRP